MGFLFLLVFTLDEFLLCRCIASNSSSSTQDFEFPGVTFLSWWMSFLSICLQSGVGVLLILLVPLLMYLIYENVSRNDFRQCCTFSFRCPHFRSTCSFLWHWITNVFCFWPPLTTQVQEELQEDQNPPAVEEFDPLIQVTGQMIVLSELPKNKTGTGQNSTINYGSMTSFYNRDLESKCCICLYEFQNEEQIRLLPCFHYLHSTCYEKFRLASPQSLKCPLCKASIE